MACRTTCSKCGLKFDRFSGKLINLSDSALKDFYKSTFVQEFISQGKHPTLCSDCLKEELGRTLQVGDIKFKNGRWMTSNVAYLIVNRKISQERKKELLTKLQSLDNAGLLPFKNNTEGFKSIKEMFLS